MLIIVNYIYVFCVEHFGSFDLNTTFTHLCFRDHNVGLKFEFNRKQKLIFCVFAGIEYANLIWDLNLFFFFSFIVEADEAAIAFFFLSLL